MTEDVIEIYIARNESEAAMVQGLIEQAGIECHVVGQLIQGIAGEVPVGIPACPRLWVKGPDSKAARQIVDDWESGREWNCIPGWTCPCCDAEVDAGFGVCWRCLYNLNTY